MARVRSVASLALGARNLAKVKVRQPLPALHVLHQEGDEAIPDELWALVRDEVNVRTIVRTDTLDPFRVPKVTPNFRALGPRHGPEAPKLAALLALMDPHDVATALARDGRVELGGVAVTDDEIKVSWEPKVGFVAVEVREGTAVLDLRLDEELRAEGDLRELVHRLQLARKEAGFVVTDRIEVGFAGALGEVFRWSADRIGDEVLAVSVREGELAGAEYEAELEVHGRTGRVWLKRSGR
jgi:isoleucyl-tRNA synthetase